MLVFCQAVIITFESFPLQQGLRLEKYILISTIIISFESFPLQQGLRQFRKGRIISTKYSFESIPLQQGLRPNPTFSINRINILSKVFHYNKD